MKKKTYTAPQIEFIILDNEISLALESAPPFGPEETNNVQIPEYFKNNPYQTNLG